VGLAVANLRTRKGVVSERVQPKNQGLKYRFHDNQGSELKPQQNHYITLQVTKPQQPRIILPTRILRFTNCASLQNYTCIEMANRELNECTTLPLSNPSSKAQSRRPLGKIENNSVRQRLPTVRDCSKSQSTTIGRYQRRQEASGPAANAILPARLRPSTKKQRVSIVAWTDPHHTSALWDEVISATRSTKSSEGKKVRGLSVGGRGRGKGAGTALPRVVASSTAASETGSQGQTRSVFAKPSDNNFYEFVLLPRGIVNSRT
jgi:hypothetical protein